MVSPLLLTPLLRHRLKTQFGLPLTEDEAQLPDCTGLLADHLPQSPTHAEAVLLLLALAPHQLPGIFDALIEEVLPQGGEFPAFGGIKGANHRGMLPTGETAQFLLAGTDLEKRLEVQRLFSEKHWFYQQQVLFLEPVREGEPRMSGRLVLADEYAERLLTGERPRPRFGPDFPARLVTTGMEWDDLVVPPATRRQIEDLRLWLAHSHTLMNDWQLGKRLKPGYKTLFYGPSGTGKTLTATLLGKEFGKDVYRIDLSQVVSKYIGETEKNLEKVFVRAENRDWILFFDEADALFGKRSSVQSAHDRYANQEVSFLLQRLEAFQGLVVLASNFKSNIDTAFLRRFNAIVHFPMPSMAERLTLWQQTIPARASVEDPTLLAQLATRYELTGAGILNVVSYAALKAISRGKNDLLPADFMDGIAAEFQKEDRVFTSLDY
ncbi:hypothetical protein GCM10028803_22000 [Larkinella knui]|uniref:ATP-binding protein n=1 Tax=Larkinella knui TaxID=2025310 RepID=A0A3P1CVE1_9BACT|nr:ATP-binding protein [Larkinella knui]RRB17275.1 ATP-binding protein [Larkinella knui]